MFLAIIFEKMTQAEKKRARHEPHSECLHNGIILIVYILQIVVQRYKKNAELCKYF